MTAFIKDSSAGRPPASDAPAARALFSNLGDDLGFAKFLSESVASPAELPEFILAGRKAPENDAVSLLRDPILAQAPAGRELVYFPICISSDLRRDGT